MGVQTVQCTQCRILVFWLLDLESLATDTEDEDDDDGLFDILVIVGFIHRITPPVRTHSFIVSYKTYNYTMQYIVAHLLDFKYQNKQKPIVLVLVKVIYS